MIWGFGKADAPSRGAGSGAIQARKTESYGKIERGGTFGCEIRRNLGKRMLKPTSDKGLSKVPQNGTKMRNVPPLCKGFVGGAIEISGWLIPCAVRNCAFQDLKLASPIVEKAPIERILNGVTSAVSTCGIPMGSLSPSLFSQLIAHYPVA